MQILWELVTLENIQKTAQKIRRKYFLKQNIICLNGAMGTGKTTFLKAVLNEYHVTSPSFLQLLQYGNDFIHIDAYTLNKEKLLNLTLEDLIQDKCIIVEWGNLIENFLTEITSNVYKINFKIENNNHFLTIVY